MFLYFLPEAGDPAAARARLLELAPHLAQVRGGCRVKPYEPPEEVDGHLACSEVVTGPQGEGRILAIAPFKNGEWAVGYDLDKQEWHELDGYWLGHSKDRLPGPKELRRKRILESRPVTIAGAQWQIPVVRRYMIVRGSLQKVVLLPTQRHIGEDDRWQEGEVLDRFKALWTEVEFQLEEFERLARGEEKRLPEQDLFRRDVALVLEALKANYHVGPGEASVLGLVTDETVVEIFRALVDMPGLEAIMAATGAAPAPGAA
jgi:hypothetical protein